MHNLVKFGLAGAISSFVASLVVGMVYTDPLWYEVLTNESRGAEILTAIFYIAAGGLFLWVSYKDFKRSVPVRKLILPVLLGLFFIVVGGEEESWGQWIFEFSTPEALQEVNYQNEVNFHNLELFTGWLHANTLLYRFVLLYGVLVPFAYLIVRWVKVVADRTGCPIIPVWITPVFGVAFVYRYLALNTPFPPESEVWRHAEMAEFFIAAGFLVFAIDYLLKSREQT